ncbi:sodium:proton antiporter [Cupriavidus sp.]|jgi:Na+/H+ antiporter NhaD/arsenite permease-like protein|uniref:sodium:proton antiporter n=1 Tax=Cupriavidus sp. TaxID=1873897 RepID=UPI0025C72B92|nr:sodium:proton antiporter [Cupriavidus sp.]MCA3185196.1 sodium:proton antiporter [Cupriavidus sp.]MCA3191025.1 sodium:proton antiporter [Cupriavidus sp.]MCA3199369.1 sodium:proton antiporter [Cupriavidus sp.]MCA3204636.1 sodium:proton antiporter [Cupriavidus sp.]MCA3210223.1 sodium:proton antiporter [Cupriavidus sp.]
MRRVATLLPQYLLAALLLSPAVSFAADVDGASLSPVWGVPFAGILLSIALFPLVAPKFWHHHYGKIAAAWGALFLVPFAAQFGLHAAVANTVHALLGEYIPFIVLLTALYVVAGGICVRGNLHATPRLNTGILALGTVLASLMGTTGAAMLLIRPLLRANDNRRHVAHVVVFFIFLVANAGGALTPLGDPPLFLGFLKGVEFSWTLRNILPETIFIWVVLLALFYVVDRYYFLKREEELPAAQDPTPDSAGIRLEGKINFVLLAAVVGLVLMSGLWKPGIAFDVMGTEVPLPALVRDVLLVGVTLVSLLATPHAARSGNEFNWEPMLEVGKLFAGIFLTIIPVIAMLKAGTDGAFSGVIRAVSDNNGQPIDSMYFWATGILSSFLDNAPTYLVFFNTAGGDAATLMTRDASTLAAISAGAVFMGANTYIGNAPNLMVKAIAESRGVRMPSFFGYMAWSCAVLVPLFLVMTFLFFHV